MMRIRIDINGHVIHDIEVINRGPLVTDGYADPDWRAYEFTHRGTGQAGRVHHKRSQGGVVLAGIVLEEIPPPTGATT